MKEAKKVVIVGAGCFGISTALHLLSSREHTNEHSQEEFKYDVIVLDRSEVLPAPDAASTDLNKIVRSSYHDAFYTRLARDAISVWKNRELWGDCYQESGTLVLGTGESLYADSAFLNDIAEGAKVQRLLPPQPKTSEADGYVFSEVNSDSEDEHQTSKPFPNLHDIFPSDNQIRLGPALGRAHAYMNYDGGWAYAEKAVARAIERVRRLGGKVIGGKQVTELLKTPDSNGSGPRGVESLKTCGVRCSDGSEYTADIVILATGAWTASTFPELSLGEKCLATGQSVCTIQLTEEEAIPFRSTPVILDFGPSGFYIFPPNSENVVKFAKHTGGYANFLPVEPPNGSDALFGKDGKEGRISNPRTISSHGLEDGLKIPRSEARFLRDCLRGVYPDLADKPIASTRLCWYTDSPDSDWVIDVHPSDSCLVLATAGSGHAFKFLPVIGRLVVDRLEGRMPPDVRERFALNRPRHRHDLYRAGALVRTLEDVGEGDMVGAKELAAETK